MKIDSYGFPGSEQGPHCSVSTSHIKLTSQPEQGTQHNKGVLSATRNRSSATSKQMMLHHAAATSSRQQGASPRWSHHGPPHSSSSSSSRHKHGTAGGAAPPKPVWLTLGLGLLVGLCFGHLIMRHQQAVVLSHLYVSGHNDGQEHSQSAQHSSSSSSMSHRLPGSWSETGGGGSSSTTATPVAGATTATPTAGTASVSKASRASFIKGTGPRSSFMYSTSSVTGVTKAEAERIAATLQLRAAALPGNSIHALMTGNGSPYQNIQARIMYASMKLVQQMPGGENIKAFTRIMHRTTDDDLVGEFPTFRAYPLQPECDTWCEFPVKDRPNAVMQWLMAAEQHPELIQGAWLLMLESDYVWMRPMQLPGSAHDVLVQGYGFEYDYIDPAYPDAAKVMLEMCPDCDVNKIPKSGPAPVLLRPYELAKIGPDWESYTAWIESNDNAKQVLGWVREMYAWCVSVHKNNVQLVHQQPPKSRLISQPPHNWDLGEAAMLHYTWGTLFLKNDKEVWRFDKRDWTAKEHELKVPQFQLPPQPWEVGWKLQDGTRINRDLHQLLIDMLTQMNKASGTLPTLQSVTQ